MPKFAIVAGKELTRFITSVTKRYATLRNDLHIAAISSLVHAGKHGDVRPLNQLYSALGSNDQQALKLFVRRAHAIIGLDGENPDGKASEIVTAAVMKGTVFGFADKQFTVINSFNTANARTLVKLAETRFINPDGENDKMVFERNNFAEVRTLGDTELLNKIIQAMKELDAGSNERREVHASPKVSKFIRTIGSQAKTMLDQLKDMPAVSDDRKPRTEVIKAQAKPAKAKPRRVAKPRVTKSDKQAALAAKAKTAPVTSDVITH